MLRFLEAVLRDGCRMARAGRRVRASGFDSLGGLAGQESEGCGGEGLVGLGRVLEQEPQLAKVVHFPQLGVVDDGYERVAVLPSSGSDPPPALAWLGRAPAAGRARGF